MAQVHFDWVYMGRGAQNLYTTWMPIGDVSLSDGPLAILEGSRQIQELRHTYGRLDVDRDKDKKGVYVGGWLSKDAPAVQAPRTSRTRRPSRSRCARVM